MFKSGNLSIKMKLALPVGLIAFAILGTMTFLIAKDSHEEARKNAQEFLLATAQANSRTIRIDFENGLTVARSIGQVLLAKKEAGATNRELTTQELKHLLVENKHLIGTWVGWEPNAWDGKDAEYVGKPGHDKSGRFVPYWSYDKGTAYVSPLLDYDKQGSGDYYLVPLARQKETVVEPYLYDIAGVPTLMTSLTVPVIKDGKALAVAGVDIGLKKLQDKVSKVKPYSDSQAYIVSNSGNWVTHENPELITKPAEFEFENDKIKAAIAKGEIVEISGKDPKTGQEYLFVSYPITMAESGLPWAMVIKTPTKSVFAAATKMLYSQVFISFAGLVILLAAVFFVATYISKVISDLSAQLASSNGQVTNAIHQLTSAGVNLSEASSASAASLEETVASLEEMTSMVKMNSENAKSAAALSTSSSEAAVKGEQEINELIISMKDISESSKKIEEIINVIDDIAFQTNLLALNASVEAARAGEHGKGFAVVAEAVRSLAQRSAVAAKDITDLIKESVHKIERGTDKADKSGEVLKTIVHSVKKVSDLNNEIAAASEEQAAGIQQISKAMNQLDQSVQSNAASSEEIASTAEEINSQAKNMAEVVHHLNEEIYGEDKDYKVAS